MGPSIKVMLVLIIIFSACAAVQEKTHYDELRDYEGKYEYTNPKSLDLAASTFDTTLYAIIDDAQYPLAYVSQDTFQTPQKQPLTFQRNGKGEVVSYQTDGSVFKKLAKVDQKHEWFPRKELYQKAEAYRYKQPEAKEDGLQVGDLRKAFRDPDLLAKMVKETIKGEYRDVHSILIWKDGKLVMEEYFYGYDQDTPHQLRSASKSFIGALVGIAIDRGQIKSENERLLSFFESEYAGIANRDPRKDKLTIKDFLTYRHGMDCNDEDPNTAGHELKMYETPDWVKFTLGLPMIEEPGARSSYCTGCAQTVGRLVEVATRTPLVEYADKNLFAPMGIINYKWRFAPDTSSKATFNQMYLRPRDVLKLAIMYHDNGKWRGKQILSADWVRKTFEKDDVEFGYLWRHKYFELDGKRYDSYLATGNGGQKINIWPELNMITVFTGGNYNSYLYGRSTPPNEMIPQFILKAL
jgi:CubicO group peptidase (beta-lactamase class C family)